MAIYDRKGPDVVYTWTTPLTFPDKIQALMQAVNIGEYAILNVTRLDRFLGEQIVALDHAEVRDGFIIHSYEVDRDKLKAALRGTLLSSYRFVDSIDQLKDEILKLGPRGMEGPALIPVDHAFDVKGVGTVALGVVKQGSVSIHDELILMPSKSNVTVKSIQMHDDPVESSHSPSRVGLAIKGVSANELSRGDVICAPDALKVSSSEVLLRFTKSPFFRSELPENQMYMISIGMQIRAARIKKRDGGEGDNIFSVMLEKPAAYKPGQSCILLKPDNQGSRIIGKGLLQ